MILHEDSLIKSCQEIVRIKSYSGEEGLAAKYLKQLMMSLNFDKVWIDRYGSVIGKIQGLGKGPVILFDGHIDTVPADNTSDWNYDPFGGEMDQNRIYGRGSSDMKGSVTAMVFAVAQIKQSGIIPSGDIYVSGTVFEEVFEGVSLKNVVDEVKPDMVIIGESTGLNLNIGQRGRAEIKIKSNGRTAHSSNPEYGDNAIYKLIPFIHNQMADECAVHPQLGKGISVITDIHSEPYPGASVIPDQCTITIDRRLLIEEDELKIINQYMRLTNSNDLDISIAEQELTCYTGEPIFSRRFYPAWLMEADASFVQAALKALHGADIPSKIASYQFCTNGSYSAGIANIPTIGFGPSYEHMAHIVDEYIEIEHLIKATEGYYSLAKTLNLMNKEEFLHV